jgi:hypothetical protein
LYCELELVVENIAIGVAQYLQAKATEEASAVGVVFKLFGVTVAVDFNDQMPLGAREVDDVGSDGLLAVSSP